MANSLLGIEIETGGVLIEFVETAAESGGAAHDPQSAAYCNARDPASLLYQAVNCSDQPLTCGVTQRTHVPSVSRAEYAAGKVELAYAKCSVWFGRTAGAWSVVDSECTGED